MKNGSKLKLCILILLVGNLNANEEEAFDSLDVDAISETVLTTHTKPKIDSTTVKDFEDQFIRNVDYCNMPQCLGLNHIACNNTGTFSSRCPAKVRLIDISLYQKPIVKWHNRRRNELATGKLQLLPAIQMSELQWDDELAYLAKLYVIGCESYRQKCHTTNNFQRTGMNVGSITYNGYTADISERQLFKSKIWNWFRTWQDDTLKLLHIYSSENHFGTTRLLISDQNTHVGCAAIIFEQGFGHKFLMACIYGYLTFEMPLSELLAHRAVLDCKTGKSEQFSHLCRSPGPFEENKFLDEDDNFF